MKLVIDTNILVSAVIRDRLPERVLRWCLAQPDFTWLVTPFILDEYLSVIRRPKFGLDETTILWWIELISADTLMIYPDREIEFPRDRKDAPFLECASAGHADYLITGDSDYSEAQRLIQTPIVSLRQFAQIMQPELLSF